MIRLPRPSSLRLLTLATIMACLASTTGCVSMDEHKRLQTAFDQARAQLAEAENDLNAMRQKVGELEAKIAELNRLLNNTGDLGALKRERDLLAQQLADLQKKYNDLLAAAQSNPVLPAKVNSALIDLAAKYPDLLEYDERLGMIRFKSDLTFDLGSTEVKPRAREALAKFADILDYDEIKNQEIQVVGHTDDVPIRQTNTMKMNPNNWILSTNRAWAVSDVLHANGVAQNRITGAGWGDQRPIAPNAPGHRGNEKNRRVDIYIRPTTVPEGLTVSTPGAARPAPAPRRGSPAPRTAPKAPPPTAPATPSLPADMMPTG